MAPDVIMREIPRGILAIVDKGSALPVRQNGISGLDPLFRGRRLTRCLARGLNGAAVTDDWASGTEGAMSQVTLPLKIAPVGIGVIQSAQEPS